MQLTTEQKLQVLEIAKTIYLQEGETDDGYIAHIYKTLITMLSITEPLTREGWQEYLKKIGKSE